jgi:plasmid stabilization system protein ParE
VQVLFHRLATADYLRGIAWYRAQRSGASARYVAAVEDAVARIEASPHTGSPCYGAYYWVRVRRFPYLIYYRVLTDSLTLIYAVAHAHRRPGYWLRRVNLP